MLKLKLLLQFFFFLIICSSASAQDWPNLERYHSADSVLMTKPVKEGRVVFMGNSITDIWIQHSPDFWNENPYIDRGISGQTTPQMLIRFQQDVIHLQPEAVVILAGTNDLAGNTGPSTLLMIKDNITSMAQIAQANGIQVILSSILPVYDYPWKKGTYPAQKIVALNHWMEKFCAQNDFTYLDYYSHLVDDRGGMKAIYSEDGVHPNNAGYKVMEPLAKKAIEKVLSH